MERPPRILISAGEASGDRLGAGLALALRRLRPEIDLLGMGGPQMAEAGVRLVQDASEVSVVGIVEVLSHLPAIRRAMAGLEACVERERPDLVVPIDFPDFNLELAARVRRAGVEVVYFVSPQLWAWRRGRIRLIRDRVRRMLVLFPFETEIYERAGVPVTFVGHPVVEGADERPPRDELCRKAGLDPRRPILAVMPGSRRGELVRHLPPMLDAVERLRGAHPELQVLLPLAPGLSRDWVAEQAGCGTERGIRLHAGDWPEILSVCEAGVVASGTASLEAAVEGLPIVVVYKMSPLSYALGRTLVRLDDVALPNLVAGRRIVPELIQRECSGERIAEALARYLDRPGEAESVRRALGEVRSKLGGPGAFDRAASQLLRELPSPRPERQPG